MKKLEGRVAKPTCKVRFAPHLYTMKLPYL